MTAKEETKIKMENGVFTHGDFYYLLYEVENDRKDRGVDESKVIKPCEKEWSRSKREAVDKDGRDREILELAIRHSDYDLVKFVIDGRKEGSTELLTGVYFQMTEVSDHRIFDLLFEHGMDTEGDPEGTLESPLLVACLNNRTEVVRSILKHNSQKISGTYIYVSLKEFRSLYDIALGNYNFQMFKVLIDYCREDLSSEEIEYMDKEYSRSHPKYMSYVRYGLPESKDVETQT